MKLHEYEPIGGDSKPLALHREGSTVLTCAACGCRLIARESLADGGGYGPDAAWRHFDGNRWDTDARGCRVECMDRPHRIRLEGAVAS
jgi:hypothetical protein